jgi:hypothetical protein
MTQRYDWRVDMRGTRHRSPVKSVVATLCVACFLTMSLGTVSRTVAADTWETWPKKTAEPGVGPKSDANGAAQAGDAAGKKTAKGVSAGTIGWIAAGTAAVVGIAIAVGSGGGGSTSNH